jgi:anti-anti-sigma regulatory factor
VEKLLIEAKAKDLTLRYLILDASVISYCDTAGVLALAELGDELKQDSVIMLLASASGTCNKKKSFFRSISKNLC